MKNFLENLSIYKDRKVHLGITGSIACCQSPFILRSLLKMGCAVSAIVSRGAQQFITPLMFETLGAKPVYFDLPEKPTSLAEKVFQHLEPGADRELFLIAPASASTLAKIANGLADDLISAQALAYPKPIVFAPAMNPRMWQNPSTQHNVATLQQRGHKFIFPDSGIVACKEEGTGKLADNDLIILEALKLLTLQDLAGKNVLITLGPTCEHWDYVRFWSNASSGIMGQALALAAYLRGAKVHAICGPSSINLPSDIQRINVTSANEMFEVANDLWEKCHYGAFAAAVADFTPTAPKKGKIAKNSIATQNFKVEFTFTNDIVKSLAQKRKAEQKILAFAAETVTTIDELRSKAIDKFKRKQVDLLAANPINWPNCGCGTLNNEFFVYDNQEREAVWQSQPKADCAWHLWSWLLTL